jgi:hypothetical protein
MLAAWSNLVLGCLHCSVSARRSQLLRALMIVLPMKNHMALVKPPTAIGHTTPSFAASATSS